MVKESFCKEDTFSIGVELGKLAKNGEVYCIYGDLGVGKTIISQGFAHGIGISEVVNSPTFTIVKEYDSGRLPFYHFDVYRIGDPDEMDEIGFTDMVYGEGVCLIEWANLIEEILPVHHTRIEIKKNLDKGVDYREIIIEEV